MSVLAGVGGGYYLVIGQFHIRVSNGKDKPSSKCKYKQHGSHHKVWVSFVGFLK